MMLQDPIQDLKVDKSTDKSTIDHRDKDLAWRDFHVVA